MKKEKYIVEIEMPDDDATSSMYIQDVIQSDCDIEDEGRWKVFVKEYWKPSDEQMKVVEYASRLFSDTERGNYYSGVLQDLLEQLKKLKE